jgi:hypothetical protein
VPSLPRLILMFVIWIFWIFPWTMGNSDAVNIWHRSTISRIGNVLVMAREVYSYSTISLVVLSHFHSCPLATKNSVLEM